MNRHLTGTLILSVYIPERNCNGEKVIVRYSKKMKAKYLKEDV